MKDTMITFLKLWRCVTQVNAAEGDRSSFDRQTTAIGVRIPTGRRARLLSTVVFRLWAAASICLATDGATAADGASVLPPICAAADVRLITLIEAHGEAQDVAAETLAQAFFTVIEARKACNAGQVEAAMKLYESIPLREVMPRTQ
jgi:hypothetical protein